MSVEEVRHHFMLTAVGHCVPAITQPSAAALMLGAKRTLACVLAHPHVCDARLGVALEEEEEEERMVKVSCLIFRFFPKTHYKELETNTGSRYSPYLFY